MRNPVRVGTRGSPLALTQANQVVELLQAYAKDVRFEVVPIRTRGDKMHDIDSTAIQGKSVFTHEIEEALAKREIHMAVHSMKDLTTQLPQGLAVGAIPERADPRDVFISRDGSKFRALHKGARVGTSSARRKAQLLAARGDLQIVDVHGNVDTRIRKLERGDYDAIVLAAAGLIRLGLEKYATEFLSTDVMLPAVGQGAIAVQTREDNGVMIELLSRIDHKPTRIAVEAERAFAQKLGADCRTPIAAYARLDSGELAIDGMVASSDGRKLVRSGTVAESSDPVKAGEALAQTLLSKGAAALLEVC